MTREEWVKKLGPVFDGTDYAMLVERIGYKVKMIEGSYNNIKIQIRIEVIQCTHYIIIILTLQVLFLMFSLLFNIFLNWFLI